MSILINNIRFGIRYLKRQRINTFLHIVGLTLGTSVCLVIAFFLRYELRFDAYHEYAKQTYRVNTSWTQGKNEFPMSSSPFVMTEALRQEVSGLRKVVRAETVNKGLIEIGTQKPFVQSQMLITEPEFLDMFQVIVISGDARKALREPFHAILTQSAARKFFGTTDALGRTFKFKNKFLITISAIVKDLPAETHLRASVLLSYVNNEDFLQSSYQFNFGPSAWAKVFMNSTFVTVEDGRNPVDIENQLNQLADKNINSNPGMGTLKCRFILEPLAAIHFDTKYGGGPWSKSINPLWLWVFGTLGIIVLALACINFVNLSTAQAMSRSLEVGVRKCVGAGRLNLISQFLTESWMMTFLSTFISVILVKALLPYLNNLLEIEIQFDLLNPEFILILLLFAAITGLLAGLYPAWIISRFNPVSALKRNLGGRIDGLNRLRKGLVITQFAVSSSLIIAVYVVAQQVNFMRTAELGFSKENIIVAELPDAGKAQVVGNELRKISSVQDFSFANNPPSTNEHWWTPISRTNGSDPDKKSVILLDTDQRYFKLFNLKLISGRLPMESDLLADWDNLPEDKQIVKTVVNEELLKELDLGSPEEALGKRFWYGGGSGHAEIIGVFKDFKSQSVQHKISPTMISLCTDCYSKIAIKIEENANLSTSLAEIEKSWLQLFPNTAFEFYFLDQMLDSFYKEEQQQYALFKILSGVAILISCLGLFGLATLAAQKRTREIGVRKVLGASARQIVTLLSVDFFVMVLIAFCLSAPVVYYFLNQWLQEFAFHVAIGWEVFTIAAVALMSLTLCSVSFQALSAAADNPVNSLRSE